MNETFIYSIITVSAIGTLAAIILYFVAQKFKVIEDPRIDEVDEALPGANCGGCGYAGCRAFAEACVKGDDFESLFCPVGGNECMSQVAGLLGRVAVEKDPTIAVLRCNGGCDVRPKTNKYDGAANCSVAASLYSGDTGCAFGCLEYGDCEVSCSFGAITMNPKTGLPVVDEDKCTSCGDCVTACPRNLFELRKKGRKGMRVFVSCMNEEKGGIAKKSCSVACIGCSKCVKVCPKDAIEVKNSLAYINYEKCTGCRKCVPECPTEAIVEVNYPPRKVKPEGSDEKPKTKPKTVEENIVKPISDTENKSPEINNKEENENKA